MNISEWKTSIECAEEELGNEIAGDSIKVQYEGKSYWVIGIEFREASRKIAVRLQESDDVNSPYQCELIYTEDSEFSYFMELVQSFEVISRGFVAVEEANEHLGEEIEAVDVTHDVELYELEPS